MAFDFSITARRDTPSLVYRRLQLTDADADDQALVDIPREGRILRIRAVSDGNTVLPRIIDAESPGAAAFSPGEIMLTPDDAEDELDRTMDVPYVSSGRSLIEPGGTASGNTVRIEIWIGRV